MKGWRSLTGPWQKLYTGAIIMETGQLVKEFTNKSFKVLVSGWWMAARPWDVEARAQFELLTRLAAELGLANSAREGETPSDAELEALRGLGYVE